MMILTDPEGVIIETRGDDRSVDAGHEIHLQLGGRWAESDIGTNAIGTALASKRPVQIHASEHYCERVQTWTCAAAPILDPVQNHLLGVIDLSGHASTFSKHSLAFAVSAAEQIQATMANAIKLSHWKLVRCLKNRRQKWTNECFIVVDRNGGIVGATQNAVSSVKNLYDSAVDQFGIFGLRNVTFEQWPDTISRLIPKARCELLQADGEELGAAIFLASKNRRAIGDQSRNTPDWNKILDQYIETLLANDQSSRVDPLDLGGGSKHILSPRRHKQEKARLPVDHDEVPEMIAEDAAMRRVQELVRRAARRNLPILINGQTGTGKELLARHAHASSGRSGNFVAVNCAAIPANLIEAELFGYVEGAFTGCRPGGATGLAQQADGGTLFLDEIGEMPVGLQAVLLRLLDDWMVRPIGGRPKPVDVLLVAATNVNLQQAIEQGRLRQDLYYRLCTLEVALPPLNNRSDFEKLVEHLLSRMGDLQVGITAEAVELLAQRDWPGNIRQLKSELSSLSLCCSTGVIDAADISNQNVSRLPIDSDAAPPALQDMKRVHVQSIYKACGGNVAETARRLGVSRNTVYRLIGPSV
jgi:sigma-54 dependent transcriptional regulator, acetoin dehydrogenase operon transcriptional activator AcoR